MSSDSALSSMVENSGTGSHGSVVARSFHQRSVSRPVASSQHEVHRSLAVTVCRHLTARWRAQIHPGSRTSYARLRRWRDRARPLVLDSGCGTGESTLRLARRFEDAQVVGIDQ
ncbi:MAG: class I SAM-dependent methyltransferase, partial [Wenzhouxiangellaceae bacterium]